MKKARQHNLVLIADDDLFVRKIIKSGLEGLTQFIEVADGKDVETAYINFDPDIVFLDIHLPNKSGIEIVEKLIEMDKDAYIIMLSADSTIDNVKKVVEFGAKGFITKPFSRARLLHYFNTCPTIEFKDAGSPIS